MHCGVLQLSLALLAGTVIGVAVCRVWARSLRDRVQAYEAYIRRRLENQFKESMTTSRKPELIVNVGGTADEIRYQCSQCGKQFPLAEDTSPKEAVARLYSEFKEHVRREHPES